MEPRVRRRFLTLWAALSTPVILGVVALALHPGNTTSTRGLALSASLALLTIEAAARRRLFQFAVVVLVVHLGISVLLLLAGVVFYFGWAVAAMVVVATLAVGLLVANVAELRRR